MTSKFNLYPSFKIPRLMLMGVIPTKPEIHKIVFFLQMIIFDSRFRGNDVRGKQNKVFSRPMSILTFFDRRKYPNLSSLSSLSAAQLSVASIYLTFSIPFIS